MKLTINFNLCAMVECIKCTWDRFRITDLFTSAGAWSESHIAWNSLKYHRFFLCMHLLHQKPGKPSHAELHSKKVKTGKPETIIAGKLNNTWWLCHVLFLNQSRPLKILENKASQNQILKMKTCHHSSHWGLPLYIWYPNMLIQ